ncbi:MAG: hypothetical protein Gaeavirus15_5 [Gaeavirus sp.]|uniref:Uncharacterized protein n=1 Tax=Gaeavirus sp. TaxID=2487767 RepID=A0A3G4ZZ33_9VIRU|nr:MAG: hypothetical protein Gaeavirus15_5 [Gaeavirus sp.]
MTTDNNDKLIKIDSTVRDSLEYYDINQLRFSKFLNKIRYIEWINNINLTDTIIFYDKHKKKLLESSYEIMGIYVPKTHMWKWSWSIPSIPKKHTFISRKILEYAFNLDHEKEYLLRSELINSKVKINNDLQLDIHIGLSSYVGKQPFIFKFYNKFDTEPVGLHTDESTDNKLFPYNLHQDYDDDENYMIIYLYVLDHTEIEN